LHAGLNSSFDGDLVDMQNVSKHNDGVKIPIDLDRRILQVSMGRVPLKDRLGNSIVDMPENQFSGRVENQIL